MKITKAVIPAAGFGTRVLPATKNIPKEMFPIVDKPTAERVLSQITLTARPSLSRSSKRAARPSFSSRLNRSLSLRTSALSVSRR